MSTKKPTIAHVAYAAWFGGGMTPEHVAQSWDPEDRQAKRWEAVAAAVARHLVADQPVAGEKLRELVFELWCDGILSEQQCATRMGLDLVSLRVMLDGMAMLKGHRSREDAQREPAPSLSGILASRRPNVLAWGPHYRAVCWCAKCDLMESVLPSRMSLCPECGDKRCPRAEDHRADCNKATKG